MIRSLITAIAIACAPCIARSAPASEDSIREILRVTETRKLVESMVTQLDPMMKGLMQQVLGRALTAEEQRVADSLTPKMSAMMKEELNWDTLEPIYVRIYKQSFSQDEVDGMLAFYKSAAGEALIKKMPMVMQQSMAAMQERIGPMMQKIQKAVEETAAEIQASGEQKS